MRNNYKVGNFDFNKKLRNWKAGNMTNKKVILMVLLWVVLGIVTYFICTHISNMGDVLNDRLPKVSAVLLHGGLI